MTFAELVALRDMDVEAVAAALGVSPDARRPITGYGPLSGVDAIDAASPGVRVLMKDDVVVLVYVGVDGLPAGTDHTAMVEMFGEEGTVRRSRQGKLALMHIHAEQGVAWSELDGEVGFMEIFPATTLEDYLEWVYREPPTYWH